MASECGFPKLSSHYFEVEGDEAVPRDRRCDCGQFTWGWMDDQLAFTKMMDPTTSEWE